MALYDFDRDAASSRMRDDAASFYAHGWLFGTSGNLSVRRDDRTFLITASGKDKGRLTPADFLLCDLSGAAAEATEERPSAETKIHCAIYARIPTAGAVYHVHEPFAALCSDRDAELGATTFQGIEMMKGLDVWDEDASLSVPILANPADLDALAAGVADHLDGDRFDPRVPAVNLLRHGFYAWGANAFEAKRHVESLAYLFHFTWQQSLLAAARAT